jgi:hypothetical protein
MPKTNQQQQKIMMVPSLLEVSNAKDQPATTKNHDGTITTGSQ